jgi:exosome complex exonuclease DIS3/RRP44
MMHLLLLQLTAPPLLFCLQFVLDEEKQTVVSTDGSIRFAVFDKCAVRITVEEGASHRRSLLLALVPRSELPAGDQLG